MRVTLAISSLRCGGAERVCQLLSKGLQELGHNVTIITTAPRRDYFEAPKGVARIRLDLVRGRPGSGLAPHLGPRGFLNGMRSLKSLRDAILETHPQAVVSFTTQVNVITLVALSCSALPVIATEHNDPSQTPLAPYWRILRRVTYPRAARLVTPSRGVDQCYRWLNRKTCEVIHNPLAPASLREDSEDDLSGLAERPFIVALGRLARVKGFDLLIEAFSRIVEIFPSVRLVILGEGPERESLEAQVMDKGLGRKVLLHGAMRDPFPVLRRAEFLVLSSRAEGFGNAVIEAMACAVPVVSFDCPSGPSEIIGHEVNGLLVEGENVAALAEAMIRVLGDKDLRDAMARKARESAEAFSLDRIASQWDILLREVTGRCSN